MIINWEKKRECLTKKEMYKTGRIPLLQTDYIAICYYIKNMGFFNQKNSLMKSSWDIRASGMRNDEKKIVIQMEERLKPNTIT